MKQCLIRNIVILLLMVSIPISIGISSNITIFHHQEALAQNTATLTRPVSSFLTYHNSTYGVIVQYPSDWIYRGSENTSNASNNNNGSSSQVQTIATFIPLDRSIHALVTIGTVRLPSIFKSINISNMSSFASLVIDSIRQSTPGFQLVESSTTTVKSGPAPPVAVGSMSNSSATAAIPAQKIVYTAAGPVHKTMAVYAIKGDKAFFISYLTETDSIYSSYLPLAQKMIDSFQIMDARTTTLTSATSSSVTQTSPNSNNTKEKSTTTLTPSASPTTTTSSNTPPSNAPSQNRIAELKAAREQLLFAWNRTGFKEQFDTFVNSADGYGVYEEHKSNVFKPSEPIILYVEPVGFTHMPISGGGGGGPTNNTKLYLINMTAGIILSDKQGNVLLGRENIPLLNVISHNKNTELFMNLRVTQSSPFPAGDYVVTYTVTDIPSGRSLKIVKDIVIAGGSSSNSTSLASVPGQRDGQKL